MADLLDPILIAVFPRVSEATSALPDLKSRWRSEVFAIALVESQDQGQAFRSSWPHETPTPLLLIHSKIGASIPTGVAVIAEIASRRPSRPLAVLVMDGPDLIGFKELQRDTWNRDFSREIARAILDVQVFEYTPTWATSPPRVR